MRKLKLLTCILSLVVVEGAWAQVPELWGMTTGGGVNNEGAIIKINSDGTGYEDVYSFSAPLHYNPTGPLLRTNNGKLYGVAQGGADSLGVLFCYNPADSTLINLVDFDGTNGSYPSDGFIQATDGMFYGMTIYGGVEDSGVLFRFDPSSSIYTKLFDFGIGNGTLPNGKLMQASNGKLYGMTANGGANYKGVIFSFDISGNTYTKLTDLSSATGIFPFGAFTEASNGKLYGLTYRGGANDYGTILSFDTTSNICSSVYDLQAATDGGNSTGSLTLAANGNLYGMTQYGGVLSGYGTIISFNPSSGVFTKVYDFERTDGCDPRHSLLYASDGMFYGMTGYGGSGFDSSGTIFRFNPDSNTFNIIYDFNLNGFFNDNDLIEIMQCSANFTLYPDTSQLHHYIAVNNAAGVPPLTFDWSWGDGTHDFIAYPSHTYPDSGYYDICLTITDSVGCSHTFCDSSYFVQRTNNAMVYINVYSPQTIGINEPEAQEGFSIYPNPTNNSFIIKNISSNDPSTTLRIYNVLGEIVYEEELVGRNEYLIDAKLAKGIYFVRVGDGEKNVVRKLVVE